MYKSTFKITIAGLLLTAASYAFGAGPQETACNPQFINTTTDFPSAARNRGAHGVVQVNVQLNADGGVAIAQVHRSSGYRLLDRAAVHSVRNHWRFDVANCSAGELAVQRTVEVKYRRAPQTLSGTVNRQHAVETQELLARNRCDVAPEVGGTIIYACVPNSSQAGIAASAQIASPAKQP